MACPAYDHTRHAVSDLCRIVSGFSFSRQGVILNGYSTQEIRQWWFGPQRGRFLTTQQVTLSLRLSFLLIVVLSCVNVPCANCVPILSLSVRLFLFNLPLFTGTHLPNLGNPLSNIG